MKVKTFFYYLSKHYPQFLQLNIPFLENVENLFTLVIELVNEEQHQFHMKLNF